MKTWLLNWNLVRVLRLLLGLAVVGQGLDAGSWPIGLIGGLLALLALINVGCAGSCAVPQRSRHGDNP